MININQFIFLWNIVEVTYIFKKIFNISLILKHNIARNGMLVMGLDVKINDFLGSCQVEWLKPHFVFRWSVIEGSSSILGTTVVAGSNEEPTRRAL